MKRLRIEGFFIPDHLERGKELIAQLDAWRVAGKLASRFDETEGLENTLVAYARMLSGQALGKVLVEIRA
jgi:NADPH-dependent curcumin reductase CurA